MISFAFKFVKPTRGKVATPLKSTSGAGFTFEDKVAAFLFLEMLSGRRSLGNRLGIVDRLERQASDWEPFGDLRLIVPNLTGTFVKCGISVKSNRQINSRGCTPELCAGIWKVLTNNVFVPRQDVLALFCSPLSHRAHLHLHALCNQAAEMSPSRLDEKVLNAEVRGIYDSFRKPSDKSESGLPGHVLSNFVQRGFDFEETASRDEAEAIRLCRELLSPEAASHPIASDLWAELMRIAESLRITGGEVTRPGLVEKLRGKFKLKDDPDDAAAWAQVRRLSDQWLSEIDMVLPGGLAIPRVHEMGEITGKLVKAVISLVLGESGSGKSALLKKKVVELTETGAELVWVKSDRFADLLNAVPNFTEICTRTRKKDALLVFDALEGCYKPEELKAIAETILLITSSANTPWRTVLICQTPEWPRVAPQFTKYLKGSRSLAGHLEINELSKEDFAFVCSAHRSVARLARQPHLNRVLRIPKMLDIFLSGQLAENRILANEADLVDWWWEQQVRGAKAIAAEERVARHLATQMADELCTELSPDAVAASEAPANVLIRNRVLRRTIDGRIRFQHDLLADWSRVKHLLTLGDESFSFMRSHAENPPWLRAMRLMSQYFLDRAGDFNRWRLILNQCNDPGESSAENLQVLDTWLEGIAFCGNSSEAVNGLKSELFHDQGKLLGRFVRRLLHVGTIPDPFIQDRWRGRDEKTAEAAATFFRLPQPSLWMPVLQFLVNNADQATEYIPEEIAEIGIMWGRLDEYLHRPWPILADLVLQNAEREFQREIAGHYRSDVGARAWVGGNDPRVAIYTAGLYAGYQRPERAGKLALKASGRLPWEDGDLPAGANEEWKGQVRELRGIILSRPRFTGPSPDSWEHGPRRRVSDDFAKAWFQSGAARGVFQKHPEMASEATLGFLLAWPKFEMSSAYSSDMNSENHGFSSAADDMGPPFWTTGPFLMFFRENWQPALDLVVELVNFATDRYCDWWPYEPVSELSFTTSSTEVVWKGNHQVYAWHHYNMNVVEAVSCALMALEKWLDDRINAAESVSEAIQVLFQKGRSLAFAGVLISLGKRHPALFLNELRPLLLLREPYMCDSRSVMESAAGDFWPQETRVIKELRREWNNLPGRKTSLLDECCHWFLTIPEFQPVLAEAATSWRDEAKRCIPGSEAQLTLLRWASNFDRSNWKRVVAPDGGISWTLNRPAELRDRDAEKEQFRRQFLITIPMQCSEALINRPKLPDEQFESIWSALQNWTPFEQNPDENEDGELGANFLDHRHARAGLLAVLLSLGHDWLRSHPIIHRAAKDEVRRLLNDPPRSVQITPDDIHDDGEGFLARCAVHCWIDDMSDPEWRAIVAEFVVAFRYRTVQAVFEEVYHERQALGSAVRDLQAFALAFAVIRKQARSLKLEHANTKLLDEWYAKWIPKFAAGKGPEWPTSWTIIESIDEFPGAIEDTLGSQARRRRVRRNYGFDVSVLLAAFAGLPALADAIDSAERQRWLGIAKELLGTLIRTLPTDTEDAEERWEYQVWKTDDQIFDSVARRLFECSREEQKSLWLPVMNLPPAASHHITRWLSAVFLQSVRNEPPQITELLQAWKDMAEYLRSKSDWVTHSRNCDEVWKYIFIYGTPFSSFGDEVFIPFIEGLRELFKWHVTTQLFHVYEQSSFAHMLSTPSGEILLVDALGWFCHQWENADDWFWRSAADESGFAQLLRHAWRGHFAEIRKKPQSLKGFKTLMLGLATQQVPLALEVQVQIGTEGIIIP